MRLLHRIGLDEVMWPRRGLFIERDGEKLISLSLVASLRFTAQRAERFFRITWYPSLHFAALRYGTQAFDPQHLRLHNATGLG